MVNLYDYLDISLSVWESISRKADAVWQWYLHKHPAPSWIHIADALYCGGLYDIKYHTVLEGLKDQVPSLKGESMIVVYMVCTMHGCLHYVGIQNVHSYTII